jgi:hypothetical protein
MPLTQDFNTGDIYNTGDTYNSGQFPPARADYPAGRVGRPRAGGPVPRPGGPGRANALAGPNGFAGPGAPTGPNTRQQFQPSPRYPPAQDYNTGQGHAAAPRSQPGPGYPQAGGYAPGQGLQRPGPQDGRSNQQLHAVRYSFISGTEGMGPGGGQMVQYGGGQAVALADPAWQGDPREALATMPAPASAPPRPRIALTRPRIIPTQKPHTRPRQYKAMRVAVAATATLFAFAAATGATEIALHGFKFFVFRASGVGETSGTSTDQSFLAQQAAAAKAASQKAHTLGRHSAKSTSG